MFFRRRKKQKFFDASVRYFFEFGRAAGLKNSDIEAALPRMEDVAAILAEAFKGNLRPIDGGIILSQIAVRDAYEKKQNSELVSKVVGKGLEARYGNERGLDLSRELTGAWADGSIQIAEKIQMKALDFGVILGSSILPSEGNIVEAMDEFTKPHSDFDRS